MKYLFILFIIPILLLGCAKEEDSTRIQPLKTQAQQTLPRAMLRAQRLMVTESETELQSWTRSPREELILDNGEGSY